MGIYAYCLVQPHHTHPGDATGHDDAPVRDEEIAGFRVWVSDLARAPAASLDGIRIHNAVIEAATAHATPLPFRFGQWFASRAELARSLEERSEVLDQRLNRVAGMLEFGIRVVDPAYRTPVADRGSGTAYMEGLARRARGDELDRERGREIAAALRHHLGPLVRDERVRFGGGATLAAIAYLVDRHDTGKYESRVRDYPASRPGLRFFFTGPWPPYGFVE